MKKKWALCLMAMFAALLLLNSTIYATKIPVKAEDVDESKKQAKDTLQLPEIEGIDKAKPIEITDEDNANFKKMTEAKDFDPALAGKVAEYLQKLQNNIYVQFAEIRKILTQQELWQLESVKYPDVFTKAEKPKDDNLQKEKELEYVDTGKRLKLSASIDVIGKFESIKGAVTEYHSALYAYLKYRYGQVLKPWLAELKESADESKKDNIVTPFDAIWSKLNIADARYAEAFAELKTEAQNRNMNNLISLEDDKLIDTFEHTLIFNKTLSDVVLKGTFRSSWHEFGIGWIMLIFGVLTLYGGLIMTFVLDFRKKTNTE